MNDRGGRRTVAVVGGGAWGTALVVHLAGTGHDVAWWIRGRSVVERVRERGDNPAYLPGVTIPKSVQPDHALPVVLANADLVVTAVPAQFCRGVYRQMAPYTLESAPVVVATKGIEEGSLALPLEVARDELGSVRPLAVLSGPSFAPEVARGLPTAVVVSSTDRDLAQDLQRSLSSLSFRLYTNADPVGVQVAGAVKNVLAIAAGVADSLGMGTNALAAFVTRGLNEMGRLALALGGAPATLSGLAGLGDLVLTCTGELSRNRRVGQRLGRGERLEDILATSRSVAEGVATTRAACGLARRVGVDMPIVEEVHRILFDEGSPREALERLLNRPLTSEEERGAHPSIPR